MFIKISIALVVLAIPVAHLVDHVSPYVSIHHDQSPLYKIPPLKNENNKDNLKYDQHRVTNLHHPKYEYKYGVEDLHTGDIKSLKESRDGDVAKGEYSVVQPDGRIRTVKFTADPHNGFKVEVVYSDHAVHPILEKMD